MSDAQEYASEIEKAIKLALAPYELDGFMIAGCFKRQTGEYGSIGTMIWEAPDTGEGSNSPIMPLGRLAATMFRAAEGWGIPSVAVMAAAMDAMGHSDVEKAEPRI